MQAWFYFVFKSRLPFREASHPRHFWSWSWGLTIHCCCFGNNSRIHTQANACTDTRSWIFSNKNNSCRSQLPYLCAAVVLWCRLCLFMWSPSAVFRRHSTACTRLLHLYSVGTYKEKNKENRSSQNTPRHVVPIRSIEGRHLWFGGWYLQNSETRTRWEQSRWMCDATGKRNNMDLGILGSTVLLKSKLLGKKKL